MNDYYKILGVHPGSSDDDIKDAHRRASRKYHPDRPGGDAEMFRKAQEAFKNIKDAAARRVLRTKLLGLCDPCSACNGKGYKNKSRGFTVVSTEPCDRCDHSGFVPRGKIDRSGSVIDALNTEVYDPDR